MYKELCPYSGAPCCGCCERNIWRIIQKPMLTGCSAWRTWTRHEVFTEQAIKNSKSWFKWNKELLRKKKHVSA